MYGIITEDLVIREIRIDEAAASDKRVTSFEVIMPLNSNQLWKPYCETRCIASVGNSNGMFRQRKNGGLEFK